MTTDRAYIATKYTYVICNIIIIRQLYTVEYYQILESILILSKRMKHKFNVKPL